MLADGSVLDTGDPASRAEFLGRHAELAAGVGALAAQVQVGRMGQGRGRCAGHCWAQGGRLTRLLLRCIQLVPVRQRKGTQADWRSTYATLAPTGR